MFGKVLRGYRAKLQLNPMSVEAKKLASVKMGACKGRAEPVAQPATPFAAERVRESRFFVRCGGLGGEEEYLKEAADESILESH